MKTVTEGARMALFAMPVMQWEAPPVLVPGSVNNVNDIIDPEKSPSPAYGARLEIA